MKSVTSMLSKLLAAGAIVAFVAAFGTPANASGDPDSIARKYPSLPAYPAPASPDRSVPSPNDPDVGSYEPPPNHSGGGHSPVNLGQGSGMGPTFGR
jgi:hypothetical protein